MSTKDSVLVAMSGGVDSSVATLLLQNAGYKVIGVTFRFFETKNVFNYNFYSSHIQHINDARKVALKNKFEHFVINCTKRFESIVYQSFVKAKLSGITPNPCELCNRMIKWPVLFELANKLNINYISTGHYVNKQKLNDRWFLSEAKDKSKDKTFFLWGLSQEILQKSLFPIGNYTKTEIKEIAKSYSLDVIAYKSESYNVCFIPGNHKDFINNIIRSNNIFQGNFVIKNGEIIDKHAGYPLYTIGEKVLLKGETFFIKEINTKNNQIVVVPYEEIFTCNFKIFNVNLLKYKELNSNNVYTIKIGYRNNWKKANIYPCNEYFLVKLHEPSFDICPGQSIVIMEGNDMVGGGIIKN